MPCSGHPSHPHPVHSHRDDSSNVAHTITQEPLPLTEQRLPALDKERGASTSLDMMKTLSFQRLAVDHSYTKNFHMAGQTSLPPIPPSPLLQSRDNSFLTVIDPQSSLIKLPSPVKPDRSVLLVERAGQTLVVEHGYASSPTPSLVGFSLLLDTESDSSGESLSDSAEAEDCWIPLSLVVSVPHSLLQKRPSSVDSDAEQGGLPSSPVSSRHRAHKLHLPRNGLYLYATRKGGPKQSGNSWAQRGKGVRFAGDGTEHVPERSGEEEEEEGKRRDEEEECETKDGVESSLSSPGTGSWSVGRESAEKRTMKNWGSHISVKVGFGVLVRALAHLMTGSLNALSSFRGAPKPGEAQPAAMTDHPQGDVLEKYSR